MSNLHAGSGGEFLDLDLDTIAALLDHGPLPGCYCEDCDDERDFSGWQSEIEVTR